MIDWNEEGKLIIKYLNGGEDLANYNDIINKLNQSKEESVDIYVFSEILDHREEKGKYMLKILWDTEEVTWEQLKNTKECDPLTLVKYAHEKGFINLSG